MICNNRFLLTVLSLTFVSITAMAQVGGTLSSYSRFGLGLPGDNSTGFNKSMGGAGLALPSQGNHLNIQNPASYSSIDSISFIMDAGMSLTMGKMSQGNTSAKLRSAQLDYVVLAFRAYRNLGVSVGFRPYSNVGYKFSAIEKTPIRDQQTYEQIRSLSYYTGNGGIHQAHVGVGYSPVRGFSFGINANLLWGTVTNSMDQSFLVDNTVNNTYNGLNVMQASHMFTYKIDAGVQYIYIPQPDDRICFGATASLGHNTNATSVLTAYTNNTDGDLTPDTLNNAFSIPYTVGGGISWEHAGRFTLAADFHYDMWGNCHAPQMYTTSTGDYKLRPTTDAYKNSYKVNFGGEYTPDRMSTHNYFKRVSYRAGAYYSSPHLRINGQDGPSEIGVSIGAALPISNRINNRSVFNLGVQWIHRSAASMPVENYVMVSLGMTFNERWFMKFKIL